MITVVKYSNSLSLPFTYSIGVVHSIYKNAINIYINHQLITVLKDNSLLVPNSFCVSGNNFRIISNVKIDSKVIANGYTLNIGEYELDFKKSQCVDLKIINNEYQISTFKELLKYKKEPTGLRNISNTNKEKIFNSIRKFALTGNLHFVDDIIGFGDGLTPASDDMIIGSMIILEALQLYKPLNFDDFKNVYSSKTSDVSFKYLSLANKGFFSEILIIFLNKLCNHQKIDDLLKEIKKIGASSGEDMLQGMIIAIETLTDINRNHFI